MFTFTYGDVKIDVIHTIKFNINVLKRPTIRYASLQQIGRPHNCMHTTQAHMQ